MNNQLIATDFQAGQPAVQLGEIAIIAYDSGNIGVILVNEKGHTEKQLAYFNAKNKKWFRNDNDATQPEPKESPKLKSFIEQLGEEEI